MRVSADGKLYTCLFAESGFDLRALLRAGAGDEDLLAAITQLWGRRDDNYSEQRATASARHKIEMSRIGG
jgi:cyclic pyranopterin phosphate synthase